MQKGQAEQEQDPDDGHEDAPGMRHHRRRQAMPEAQAGALAVEERHAQRVHPRPQHRQERGERGEAVDDGERDHDRSRPTDGAEVPQTQEQHAEEADRHGEPGEQDRAARRGDGARQRLRRRARTNLLTEAAHDEERVVDRHAQADHADDVRRVDRHRDETGEEERAGHRAGHRQAAHRQRQRGGDDRAEDEQEQQRDRGQDHRLDAAEVSARHLGEVVVERDVADGDDLERVGADQRAERRIEIGRQAGVLEGGEARRLPVQLDGHERAPPVSRDERRGPPGRVVGGSVVDAADAGHPRIAAERGQGALELGAEGRVARR